MSVVVEQRGGGKKFGNKWKSTKKQVTLVIHNITWKPKKIKVGGKRVQIAPQHNKLSIPVKWNPTTELKIRITKEKDPSKLKWSDINAEYIIDSTGIFLTEELANAHILAGAKKVIMSAPSKDETPMFVMGVNHLNYNSRIAQIINTLFCSV